MRPDTEVDVAALIRGARGPLFIVGGGISKRSSEYLPSLELRTPIIPAQLKNHAGIVGGALQAALLFTPKA